jgi:hypothetical protein
VYTSCNAAGSLLSLLHFKFEDFVPVFVEGIRGLRAFGQKKDEIVGGWRKLQKRGASEFALFARYNYNKQITDDMMGSAFSTHGKNRNIYRRNQR